MKKRDPAGVRSHNEARSRLRRRAGLTLFELSRRAGIGSGTLSQWERGQVELSLSDIEVLAGAIEAELNRYPAPGNLAEIVTALCEPVGTYS